MFLLNIYSNDKIKPASFAKYINRSIVSARKVLKELVEKGIFSWYGTSKNDSKQYYALKRKWCQKWSISDKKFQV